MADFATQKEFKMRLVINLGIVVGALFVASMIIVLLSYDIGRRALMIQGYTKELRARVDASLAISSLKTDFELAKPYFSVLENILPIRDSLISFPKDISFVAQKNKISAAVSFGSETASTVATPGFVNFSMVLEGSYDDILKFMAEVERGKYVIDWASVDFSFNKKNYTGTISGRVFSQ